MGRSNRRPEDTHEGHVSEGLDEGEEARGRHLERDGFIEAVDEHLAGERKAKEEEEPAIEHGVAGAAAIEKRPDDGGECRKDEDAESQDEVDGFVAAAAAGEDERRMVVEHVRGGEGDDRLPRRDGGGVGKVVARIGEERGEDLGGEAIEAEVDEAEAEGDADGEGPRRGGGGFGWCGSRNGGRGQGGPPAQELLERGGI